MDKTRNVARSGPEFLREAKSRLSESSHLFLRHVDCRIDSGVLYLEGKVPSFYLKQTAQTLLQEMAGPPVENRLEVVNSYGVSSTPAKQEHAEAVA